MSGSGWHPDSEWAIHWLATLIVICCVGSPSYGRGVGSTGLAAPLKPAASPSHPVIAVAGYQALWIRGIVTTDAQLALTGSSMWRKVRRANISPELRTQFELFGEDVLAHAVGAGEPSSKEAELDKLVREKRREIVEWLQERRDDRERRERLMNWIVVATIVVALVMRRLWR